MAAFLLFMLYLDFLCIASFVCGLRLAKSTAEAEAEAEEACCLAMHCTSEVRSGMSAQVPYQGPYWGFILI